MSYKRNVAAKKYKSDYLAFLDSDAYPNIKWLENANLLYNINPNDPPTSTGDSSISIEFGKDLLI